VLFIYAAPFFFTWSQSMYNFPIVPLCAVFAVAFIEAVRERSWQEVVELLQRSVWGRRALYATLAFFFYIQVEWMWIVVRAADQGRLASLSGQGHHVSWCVPKKRGCDGLDVSAREQHTVAMSGACYSLHPARYASRTVRDLKPMLADF
jgi:hypothetical protein